MKIIFMGTPKYAQEILKKILQQDNMEVVSVYTQPDKPVGRKKIITLPPVKVTAQAHNIDVYQPKKLNNQDAIKKIYEQNCDFIVVAAYGQILPQEIINYKICINLHASILPKYRGASPIQATLLNGDKYTGVTAMKMDAGLDTGEIIKISKVKVDNYETADILYDKLTNIATILCIDVLNNFFNYKLLLQGNLQASHCIKITKVDGIVQFNNAIEIFNKYRAFTPWPGIYLENGLKLKKIELLCGDKIYNKGEILEITSTYIVVGCLLGSLKILRVQPKSKKEMDIFSYINGKHLNVKDYLS